MHRVVSDYFNRTNTMLFVYSVAAKGLFSRKVRWNFEGHVELVGSSSFDGASIYTSMTIILIPPSFSHLIITVIIEEGSISAVVPPPGKSFNFIVEKAFNHAKWHESLNRSLEMAKEANQ